MIEIVCLRKRNLILDFWRKSIIKSRNKIRIEHNYIIIVHITMTQLYHSYSCNATVPFEFPPDFHIPLQVGL